VRYTLALEALPRTYACHCHYCQTWSGSAFSQQAIVPESGFEARGEVDIFELSVEDRVSRQRFCAKCHTRVFNTNSARPGIVALRAGTLDDSDRLEVVAHIWTKRKQPWVIIPEGAPQWRENAPPLELMQTLIPPA
jgi:hypothetical protein